MGKLNKFALAPGSLSDIGGGPTLAAIPADAPAPKPARKRLVQKAIVAPVPVEDDASTATQTDDSTADPSAAETANLEIEAGEA